MSGLAIEQENQILLDTWCKVMLNLHAQNTQEELIRLSFLDELLACADEAKGMEKYNCSSQLL
jgi:hypothetical protein